MSSTTRILLKSTNAGFCGQMLLEERKNNEREASVGLLKTSTQAIEI